MSVKSGKNQEIRKRGKLPGKLAHAFLCHAYIHKYIHVNKKSCTVGQKMHLIIMIFFPYITWRNIYRFRRHTNEANKVVVNNYLY